jgi:endogenous inhibitor of DNA gyrase (YacG/DUF329 family)
MSRWVLDCPECNKGFTYSEVSVQEPILDHFTWNVHKPEFPTGGVTVDCPNCNKSSVYQRYQLIYEMTQNNAKPWF